MPSLVLNTNQMGADDTQTQRVKPWDWFLFALANRRASWRTGNRCRSRTIRCCRVSRGAVGRRRTIGRGGRSVRSRLSLRGTVVSLAIFMTRRMASKQRTKTQNSKRCSKNSIQHVLTLPQKIKRLPARQGFMRGLRLNQATP